MGMCEDVWSGWWECVKMCGKWNIHYVPGDA